MSNAAKKMARGIKNAPKRTSQSELDPVGIELMRKLERLGWGSYLPQEEEPEHGLKAVQKWAAERDAKDAGTAVATERERLAGEDAEARQSMSAAQLFAHTLRKAHPTGNPIALNGDGVLNAVRSGLGAGSTINGA